MRLDELKLKVRMMQADKATSHQAIIVTLTEYVALLEREITVLRAQAVTNSDKLAQLERRPSQGRHS
jgi:hypothetical protein